MGSNRNYRENLYFGQILIWVWNLLQQWCLTSLPGRLDGQCLVHLWVDPAGDPDPAPKVGVAGPIQLHERGRKQTESNLAPQGWGAEKGYDLSLCGMEGAYISLYLFVTFFFLVLARKIN